MFNKLGPGEIILIVGAALLIFGPSKLPELGKAVGKGLREFKGAMKETTEAMKETVKEATDEVKTVAAEVDPTKKS